VRCIILDANLLFLLVVGRCGRDRVGVRRGTKEYSPEDYDFLVRMLAPFDRIVVTPNVLTECSNLIGENKDGKGDASEHEELRRLILNEDLTAEEYVASRVATQRSEYRYLGLSDCALLSLVDADTPIYTADARLATAALRINQNSQNFNWLRKY